MILESGNILQLHLMLKLEVRNELPHLFQLFRDLLAEVGIALQ